MFRFGVSVLLCVVFMAATLAVAQPKTGTQFYNEFLAAYAKAKSFNDLAPLMSKAQKEKLSLTTPEQQKALWEVSKQADLRDIKVVKETPTAAGATLDITGVGPDKQVVKGIVKLVKEGGAWKWDGEDSVM